MLRLGSLGVPPGRLVVMAIVNRTPDSFYDRGATFELAAAVERVDRVVAEGADMVMVKPALAYLDVLCRVAGTVDVPVAAYQVSGEYAMVEAAAAHGWVDRERVIIETLTAIRRAGAQNILTYWATEAAGMLRTG